MKKFTAGFLTALTIIFIIAALKYTDTKNTQRTASIEVREDVSDSKISIIIDNVCHFTLPNSFTYSLDDGTVIDLLHNNTRAGSIIKHPAQDLQFPKLMNSSTADTFSFLREIGLQIDADQLAAHMIESNQFGGWDVWFMTEDTEETHFLIPIGTYIYDISFDNHIIDEQSCRAILESISFLTQSNPNQLLNITVTPVNDEYHAVMIPVEDLGGHMAYPLIYTKVTNVRITLEGETQKFEDAIASGKLSLGEIFAYARLDTENGFCTEEFTSQNGLTSFTYHYPEYSIRLVYDVYETPDGKQHLISDLSIFKAGTDPVRVYTGPDGYPLDREDWGLTFDQPKAAANSVTVPYRQTGGQHMGTLSVESFYLLDEQGNRVPTLQEYSSWFYPIPSTLLQNESTSSFTIFWDSIYGDLSPGTYTLYFEVRDNYDPATLHPLMQNISDCQNYHLEFTIGG